MGQLDAAALTRSYPADVLRTVHLRHDDLDSLAGLSDRMRPEDMELIVLFVSSMADFDEVLAEGDDGSAPTDDFGDQRSGACSRRRRHRCPRRTVSVAPGQSHRMD